MDSKFVGIWGIKFIFGNYEIRENFLVIWLPIKIGLFLRNYSDWIVRFTINFICVFRNNQIGFKITFSLLLHVSSELKTSILLQEQWPLALKSLGIVMVVVACGFVATLVNTWKTNTNLILSVDFQQWNKFITSRFI